MDSKRSLFLIGAQPSEFADVQDVARNLLKGEPGEARANEAFSFAAPRAKRLFDF